jgi:hypothetical protein
MTDLTQEVKDTVSQLTDSNQIFSAYDITKLIRSKTSINIKHDVIRKQVHSMFSNQEMSPSYDRDVTEHNNVDIIVYRPFNKSISSYDPNAIVLSKSVNANTVVTVNVGADMTGTVTSSITSGINPVLLGSSDESGCCAGASCGTATQCLTTAFKAVKNSNQISKQMVGNRLTIPCSLVKNMGLNANDTIKVFYSTGVTSGKHTIVIASNHSQLPMHLWGELKVDSHQNIRLSTSLIKTCGLDINKLFVIESHPNSISVSQKS